jgi:glucosamine--fructose-6-phosphate aminotransferase (isomerizing)
MTSPAAFADRFGAELHEQPAALRRAAARLRDQLSGVESLAGAARSRAAIVFTGMGGSYHTCYTPVTVLGEAGIPAVMVDAAELLHFRRPILRADTLLVAVSQSGESAEVVRLLQHVEWPRGRPFVVSVTNGVDNTVARAADAAFDTAAGDELGPSTMTFGAALVALSAVAGALQGESPDRTVARVQDEAERAARMLANLLDAADPLQMRRWLGDRPTVAIVGRGTARAGAEMAALLLKEAARLPAESLEAAQFRHGPLELAGSDLAAAVLATEPATLDLDLRLASDLASSGTSVLVIGGHWPAPTGSESIPLALDALPRSLAAAVAIVPLQLLARDLARERGRRPERLAVASKVTTRE